MGEWVWEGGLTAHRLRYDFQTRSTTWPGDFGTPGASIHTATASIRQALAPAVAQNQASSQNPVAPLGGLDQRLAEIF